jgi:hypothetical protein
MKSFFKYFGEKPSKLENRKPDRENVLCFHAIHLLLSAIRKDI